MLRTETQKEYRPCPKVVNRIIHQVAFSGLQWQGLQYLRLGTDNCTEI